MPVGKYQLPIPFVIIGAVFILLIVSLIIISLVKKDKSEKTEEILEENSDTTKGKFSGLLTEDDFNTRCEDPMLEMYRVQWIKADQGEQKDINLVLYLAMKQLLKEQDESENEWTQEECELRMDQIINELSEKTGIKVEISENDSEYEEFFNQENEEDDN